MSTNISKTNSPEIDQLAVDYWDFFLDEHPVTAMECGVQSNNHLFFKDGAVDYERRHLFHLKLEKQVKKLDATGLEGQAGVIHALLHRELSGAIKEYEFQAHMRPLWFPFGPEMNLAYAIQTTDLCGGRYIDAFIQRLESIPAYFKDKRTLLEAGIQQGFRVPEALIQPILNNVRGYLKSPDDESGCWYGPLTQLSLREPAETESARKHIGRIVAREILPAWQNFADVLEAKLSMNSRPSISCLDDPDGSPYYEFLVEHHTSLDIAPQEIHEIGISEVNRISGEIQLLAEQSKFCGNVSKLREYLRSDTSFISSSKQELLGKMEMLSKRIDRKIPEFFGVIPRMTYGIDCIPESVAPQMPPAYAQANPANRTQAGIHWVTSLPEKCPSYLHVPLALHEAWPGHLMHIALLKENKNQPDFIRYGFMNYTSLLEGWALYCERLGQDFGLYEDEYQNVGRLEMELWRAMRLVVDTGIHTKSWSRDQAIAYMENTGSLTRGVIESEVDRYIGMPGQALAYKIGEMKLLELRDHAERALGPQFNLRDFHDCVLSAGTVTLPLLQAHVTQWRASYGSQ